MAKHSDKTNEKFDAIIIDIAESGIATRDAIKRHGLSTQTFFKILEDEEKSKQYAYSVNIRTEMMADEMLAIADAFEDDIVKDAEGREIVNHNIINRNRLQVDTRKWLLAKMNPKKYGDKLQLDNKINLEAREAFKALFPTQDEIDNAG